VAEWQGARLQSAYRGFDSRLMLDGSVDGSDPGLLNLAAGFDSLASFAAADMPPPYVDVTRASEARSAGSSPAGGTLLAWSNGQDGALSMRQNG
jgi:hypothetical protein